MSCPLLFWQQVKRETREFFLCFSSCIFSGAVSCSYIPVANSSCKFYLHWGKHSQAQKKSKCTTFGKVLVECTYFIFDISLKPFSKFESSLKKPFIVKHRYSNEGFYEIFKFFLYLYYSVLYLYYFVFIFIFLLFNSFLFIMECFSSFLGAGNYKNKTS